MCKAISSMNTFLGFILLSFLLSSCSQSADADGSATAIKNVSAIEAAALLRQDNANVVVLDIRTQAEYQAGHIEGAVNIDYYADDFQKQLAGLDPNKTYVMHCKSGGRSGKSLTAFKRLGFKEIAHLKSGFDGWKSANLPVAN